LECPIYSVKFLVVYYTSLDSGREDAEYFTLTIEVFQTTIFNFFTAGYKKAGAFTVESMRNKNTDSRLMRTVIRV